MTSDDLLSSRLQRYVLFDRVNRPYLAWQMSLFLPHLGRRILEIGCGVGGIVDLLPAKELILGIDIEDEVLAYAAQRHGARAECRFEHLDFTALTDAGVARLAALRFDTIVCINLLEQIEDGVAKQGELLDQDPPSWQTLSRAEEILIQAKDWRARKRHSRQTARGQHDIPNCLQADGRVLHLEPKKIKTETGCVRRDFHIVYADNHAKN